MDRKHKVFYQYQDIQADSLFSPMGQDDFQSRASHLKGHIVGIDWAITKGVKIRTWDLFETNRGTNSGTKSNQRVRVYVNVKF